eukprot:scaffold214876_cov35-Tisochrysis_lutea.AAC.2
MSPQALQRPWRSPGAGVQGIRAPRQTTLILSAAYGLGLGRVPRSVERERERGPFERLKLDPRPRTHARRHGVTASPGGGGLSIHCPPPPLTIDALTPSPFVSPLQTDPPPELVREKSPSCTF